MDTKVLNVYGIDYEKGVKNCMGNEGFYRKILTMFLNDSCMTRARTAFADGDMKQLFGCVHELKGVSGNAALPELYSAVVPLVEALRSGSAPDNEVPKMFSEVERTYKNACDGIRVCLAEP